MFKIILSPQAKKDVENLKMSNLYDKFNKLIEKIKDNPYCEGDHIERLRGYKKDTYSRRINKTHRLVYSVYDEIITIEVIRAWTHYKNL